MNQNKEVLERVLTGVHMGIEAIEEVKQDIKDPHFYDRLIHQERDYRLLKEACELRLSKDKEPSKIETLMLKSMIKMKKRHHEDAHHISKMLMEGSLQAIMEMYTLLNRYEVDYEVKTICEQFLELSKQHMEQWKEYL